MRRDVECIIRYLIAVTKFRKEEESAGLSRNIKKGADLRG